jgi:hypothetical protein
MIKKNVNVKEQNKCKRGREREVYGRDLPEPELNSCCRRRYASIMYAKEERRKNAVDGRRGEYAHMTSKKQNYNRPRKQEKDAVVSYD